MFKFRGIPAISSFKLTQSAAARVRTPAGERTLERRRVRRLREIITGIAILVAAVALAVIAAWALGSSDLQAEWPFVFVVKVNTAISLLLLATALFGDLQWRGAGSSRHGSAAGRRSPSRC